MRGHVSLLIDGPVLGLVSSGCHMKPVSKGPTSSSRQQSCSKVEERMVKGEEKRSGESSSLLLFAIFKKTQKKKREERTLENDTNPAFHLE